MKQEFKGSEMLSPVPAVMASLGEGDEANIITIAWTGIINSRPPMTYISVRKERHSHDILMKTGEFVINLTTEAILKQTDWCGVRSGRDFDKWKETGLTKEPASVVKCPMIAESPVNLECRVTEVKELGSHDMFMAEIVKVHVDDSIIDEDGHFDVVRAGLLAYIHGHYYTVNRKPLGRFGFSVMKPKTKKRLQKEAHEKRVEANRKKRMGK
ncbi:MAG: flavin reductase family protein [Firmicutes bacterium]|nr:flavin reductase family protein [Bacillota bacterium]MBR3183927.1 flavin reductase family protein [Bacillota bacterium]MBR3260825.1 flavin reductase family protein [Bacillota bacterium]MBR3375127.1 flavin reductase family protein [Bacillota bacterium]MBR4024464.1 flavin reductase family protein [Bacillota bacterium]